MIFIVYVVIGVVIGAGIGFFLAKNTASSQQKELGERLSESEKKLDSYQQKVAQNFAETANLVNKLTENYRDLYTHLRSSANELIDDKELRQLINEQTPSNPTLIVSDHEKSLRSEPTLDADTAEIDSDTELAESNAESEVDRAGVTEPEKVDLAKETPDLANFDNENVNKEVEVDSDFEDREVADKLTNTPEKKAD